MGSEDEEYSVESDPNKRCAHGQTNRQHDVDPMSLGRRIDEIRDNPRRRFKTWSKEHGLHCRCHRLRCSIGTLRHGDSMGNIAALVFWQAGRENIIRRESGSYMRSQGPSWLVRRV